MNLSLAARFLARAAREFVPGDWVFTGFHWPVLAAMAAWRLHGQEVHVIFEAGGAIDLPPSPVPTSTTDYPTYVEGSAWLGSADETLLALPRRYARVVLDATNVDLAGGVNSTAVGPYQRPKARLAGGGGAHDAVVGAREVVLLHGREELTRIVRVVDNVTARPGPGTRCRLITPWAVMRLGSEPSVEEWLDPSPPSGVREHLEGLGVGTDDDQVTHLQDHEIEVAEGVLHEAAERGYAVARAALRR